MALCPLRLTYPSSKCNSMFAPRAMANSVGAQAASGIGKSPERPKVWVTLEMKKNAKPAATPVAIKVLMPPALEKRREKVAATSTIAASKNGVAKVVCQCSL